MSSDQSCASHYHYHCKIVAFKHHSIIHYSFFFTFESFLSKVKVTGTMGSRWACTWISWWGGWIPSIEVWHSSSKRRLLGPWVSRERGCSCLYCVVTRSPLRIQYKIQYCHLTLTIYFLLNSIIYPNHYQTELIYAGCSSRLNMLMPFSRSTILQW